ncbi:hypothetical protein AVEN_190510-1, partial [Araneus ventricosus]
QPLPLRLLHPMVSGLAPGQRSERCQSSTRDPLQLDQRACAEAHRQALQQFFRLLVIIQPHSGPSFPSGPIIHYPCVLYV